MSLEACTRRLYPSWELHALKRHHGLLMFMKDRPRRKVSVECTQAALEVFGHVQQQHPQQMLRHALKTLSWRSS